MRVLSAAPGEMIVGATSDIRVPDSAGGLENSIQRLSFMMICLSCGAENAHSGRGSRATRYLKRSNVSDVKVSRMFDPSEGIAVILTVVPGANAGGG